MPRASITSPTTVDVACALMCTTSAGLSSASVSANRTDAGERGVDPRAASGGVLGTLQQDHAGALTEHEAVASDVVGPGGAGRVVVAGRERLHRRERGDRQRVDRRLGAATEHE